jgi:hypothetical protein
MHVRSYVFSLFVFLLVLMIISIHPAYSSTDEFQDTFNLEDCELSPNGLNSYFYLEPGYQLTLEGEEDGANIQLIMTVLNETKAVGGVETRVVEERESEDGELIEISRNYFAMCTETEDIFYFGEEVDIYEEGEIAGHEGAWLAGQDGARPGMIIPANPEVGMKYYQEVAPGIAEDRAEIISLDEVVDTPAGKFEKVLKVEETNPLEGNEKEFKFHVPGIGLIQDAELKLVKYVLPKVQEPAGIEMKTIPQTLVLGKETIQLELRSNSTISEFKLDEANNGVTFKVDGETGTGGTTEIPIGRILEGPYTVTMDGQVTNNFVVTAPRASEEVIMRISYTHSIHDVVVTGTNVVPEFPISLLVMAAALGSILTLLVLARSRNHWIKI